MTDKQELKENFVKAVANSVKRERKISEPKQDRKERRRFVTKDQKESNRLVSRLRFELKKLEIKPGDLVVVEFEEPAETGEMDQTAYYIGKLLNAKDRSNAVLTLNANTKINNLGKLETGDTLVITTEDRVSEAEAAKITHIVKNEVPEGVGVALVSGGTAEVMKAK